MDEYAVVNTLTTSNYVRKVMQNIAVSWNSATADKDMGPQFH